MQEQEQVLLQEQEMEDPDSPVYNRSTGEPVHAEEPVGGRRNFWPRWHFWPKIRFLLGQNLWKNLLGQVLLS